MFTAGLVINVYERTYRDALTPGRLTKIADDNGTEFEERVILINNVVDLKDARKRADALIRTGEATSVSLVADHRETARKAANLPSRALARRPYFLDFGIVMPHVVATDYVVGWDPEVDLREPAAWIGPAVDVLSRDSSLFSASPDWQPRGSAPTSTLERESFENREDGFSLTWGFSDQCFLVGRRDLLACDFRAFAPAAYTRHRSGSPGSFECRVEAFQRATRRARATYRGASYVHNDLPQAVDRLGRSPVERVQDRALGLMDQVLRHVPLSGPRFRG